MALVRKVIVGGAAAIASVSAVACAGTVMTQAEDGVVVYGETYFGDLPSDAPLIALFHLAGGDGRGEYGPLADWLNESGFRAIAWDQRSGGTRFGVENRTAEAFGEDPGYCAAYPDLRAALSYSVNAAGGAPTAIWGSSYSAALVFRLAADEPDRVAAVVSASPASGEPMEGCDLEAVLDGIKAPVLVLRPRREYEATKAQAETLIEAGFDFRIVEVGVHGSSTLVDARTKKDMSVERNFVASWLREKMLQEN